MRPAANKWASTAIPWSLTSDDSLQEAASHLVETFSVRFRKSLYIKHPPLYNNTDIHVETAAI